jgi:V/A-type H+-transporting ATPase subunit E
MTGLENIIGQIQSDAENAAREILADAQREANEILSRAEAEGERITKDISEEAARGIADLDQRSQSAAQLQKKKNILAAKQAIIDDMINEGQGGLPDRR